jgi:hypothetical protein
VLLDFSLAYAHAWERAFGRFPGLRQPNAYWPFERGDVERLSGERKEQFRAVFDEHFWTTVPPVDGALQACHQLVDAGYELVCVSALPPHYGPARQENLRRLGFPIERVIATDHEDYATVSPKAAALQALQPLAFVDDYLPYMVGVPTQVHRALINRDPLGSPNQGEQLQHVSSTHAHLLEFSDWWLAREGATKKGAYHGN